jgi:predicted lipoprotein with Yx(FWY)xxD motif
MKTVTMLCVGVGLAVVGTAVGYSFLSTTAAGSSTSHAQTAQVMTPLGVTMQPLGKAQGYDLGKSTASAIARDQIAYTDPRGMTLYTWDKDPAGKSTCVGECSKIFVPFKATPGATALGDWSGTKAVGAERQSAVHVREGCRSR